MTEQPSADAGPEPRADDGRRSTRTHATATDVVPLPRSDADDGAGAHAGDDRAADADRAAVVERRIDARRDASLFALFFAAVSIYFLFVMRPEITLIGTAIPLGLAALGLRPRMRRIGRAPLVRSGIAAGIALVVLATTLVAPSALPLADRFASNAVSLSAAGADAAPTTPARTAAAGAPGAPITISGTGSERFAFELPDGPGTMAVIQVESQGSYAAVSAHTLDGAFVEDVGAFGGAAPGLGVLDAHLSPDSHVLQMDSDGDWTVTLQSLNDFPVLDGTMSGSGSTAVRYDGPPGTMTLSTDTPSWTWVAAHGDGTQTTAGEPDLLSVTTPWPAGPLLVVIESDSDWRLDVQPEGATTPPDDTLPPDGTTPPDVLPTTDTPVVPDGATEGGSGDGD